MAGCQLAGWLGCVREFGQARPEDWDTERDEELKEVSPKDQ